MRLLASGRDPEVFSYSDALVLRRYRDGRDASFEAQLLRDLWNQGYPVPKVESHAGPDIVMAWVRGPTLAEATQARTIEPSTAGQTLADLQKRLHDLTKSSGGALLHLDLHPANVLVGETGPVVIDWFNARRGLPGYDVAVTALILAQVVVTPGLVSPDPEKDAAARATTPAVLAAFADNVSTSYIEHLDQPAALRLRDRYQSPTGLRLLPDAVAVARSAGHSP